MTSNKTPAGTYRGPGRFEGCFFCDRMLDMAARDLKIDRLAIRRKNLIALAEMPYPLAAVRPNDGFGDTACDSGDYASAFDRCVEEAERPHRRRGGRLTHRVRRFVGGGAGD
jgi:carbon-monoxide dehydrogenase large subunit